MSTRLEYADLEDAVIVQLRHRLSETVYSAARVTSELKSEPWPEAGQVWITGPVGSSSDEEESQDLSLAIRVIHPRYAVAKKMAATVRSILEHDDSMWYLNDGFTASLPIYSAVSSFTANAPTPTTLFQEDGQNTFNFILDLHQIKDQDPTTQGQNSP